MSLSPQDFHTFHSPSKCELRVYLSDKEEVARKPGTFEKFLIELGVSHEKAHLNTFPDNVDLKNGTRMDRVRQTKEEVDKGTSVIYQSSLESVTRIAGRDYRVLGDPDFLIREGDGYLIRDSKIAFSPEDSSKNRLQVQLYGWLYEQSFGEPPLRLELHNGLGDLVEIDYDRGQEALEELGLIVAIKQLDDKPYSAVGWSKCNACVYMSNCWQKAKETGDIATLYGVDQPLVKALRKEGIETIDQLLERFDEDSLRDFKKAHRDGLKRVGKKAPEIIRMARVASSGNEELIKQPEVPKHDSYVMFDLEGVPSYLGSEMHTFLWGMQVFGKDQGDFIAATSGFYDGGDLDGWKEFLRQANSIFSEHGDIPFVHWARYEVGMIDRYLERYGDIDGIAERVKKNLFDLLNATRNSIALPIPSYSLKVIERYIGFERTQNEYGGNWAMAKYLEALDSNDEAKQQSIMDEILVYNREDLEATWAVLEWLQGK